MDPYQHSDVAVVFYKFLCENDATRDGEQGSLGTLACQLAELAQKEFDLELQPAVEE